MLDEQRNRDDFPSPVKRLLEQQAASRCCNPGCGQSTRAQSWDGTKSVSIGTAAHIHAAAKGGARYDPTMSPEARKAADNGIWMCRNCGTLVDADEGGFPADLLRQWKSQALAARRAEVLAPATRLHAVQSINGRTPPSSADIQRYRDFVDELPSHGPTMIWLREWDPGAPYRLENAESLEQSLKRWTTPERAFSAPRIQAALITLTKALGVFLDCVRRETWRLDGNPAFARIPPEWHCSDRPRWDSAVKAISVHADTVLSAHGEFIRVAKEELGT